MQITFHSDQDLGPRVQGLTYALQCPDFLFVNDVAPTLIALTGVTNAHGPSPQPTKRPS